MSILHICCNLAGSTVFPQMFEALKEEGLEQVVFVPEKRKSNLEKNTPEGVPTYRALTVKRSDALFFFRKAQRSVPAIERQVDLTKVQLIHAHTLFTDGWIAHTLSQKHHIPYVVTLRYSDLAVIWKYEPHLRGKARAILRDAQKVIVLSSVAEETVLNTWLSEVDRAQMEPKITVIPNGIQPAWLDGQPRTACETPLRVGFAGVMTKRKCPLDALGSVHYATLHGTPCILRAVGQGKLMNNLVASLDEGDAYLGVAKTMEAMKRFYASIDVLLVPSSAETFGMVYLEAMSQGVPVLYTRGQGFDGQFEEGEVGYSVVCSDIAQQAQRLANVREDYEARSARCVDRAKNYAWPLIAKRWTAVYADVVDIEAIRIQTFDPEETDIEETDIEEIDTEEIRPEMMQ